jgi:hypothetical protein
MAHAPLRGQRINGRAQRGTGHADERESVEWLALPDSPESSDGSVQRSGRLVQPAEDAITGTGYVANASCPKRWSESERRSAVLDRADARRQEASSGHELDRTTGGFWSPCDWLPCADGKSRPVEPGTFPLAHGVPARMGRLRGYGNAIVPQVAAAFIGAYMDITGSVDAVVVESAGDEPPGPVRGPD